MSIGIQTLIGFHHYTRDLARLRRLYTQRLGFSEVARSSAQLEREQHLSACVLRSGQVQVACSTPQGASGEGAVARYLSMHPDGVAELVLEVADASASFAELERRGATPTGDIQRFDCEHGSSQSFAITTPFGDTLLRFVERSGQVGAFPGFESLGESAPPPAKHSSEFTSIDHVTINLPTMKPALLWLEHVLGLEPFWDVEFHTSPDEAQAPSEAGTGLRSQVMWDRASGLKFALNEPLRPGFENSQIAVFCHQNRGAGVQHIALATPDLPATVRAMRERGVALVPAPPRYHERLPQHLTRLGIDRIDEPLDELAALDILVDGSGPGSYLLQIFLDDSASLLDDASAGPFFFELIQRKGDAGFGEGNFRALFDSIEERQSERSA
ncbi:4-hydroxyphenylpyruvate dioxygenase family protein [Haliangium ochraceum]|uniref:4-hydroxyphenylpyruvate dioxygenase n=1 Tax=Haliangium ochraceum (strain DSM 14365 / JCM 11303 / SMP-2) TaxID=502025 RepID=D0LNU2_HALO1|nr:VOC family protein [Haliangium ochraceum]ACY18768.1 4-hydroxyphenylpyruvate dioxygenase [Haliangium ochraceum DSM 14365]